MFVISELSNEIARISTILRGEHYVITLHNDAIGRTRLERFCAVFFSENPDVPYDYGDIILFDNKYYTPAETCPEDYQYLANASPSQAPKQWVSIQLNAHELQERQDIRNKIIAVWDADNSIDLFN